MVQLKLCSLHKLETFRWDRNKANELLASFTIKLNSCTKIFWKIIRQKGRPTVDKPLGDIHVNE